MLLFVASLVIVGVRASDRSHGYTLQNGIGDLFYSTRSLLIGKHSMYLSYTNCTVESARKSGVSQPIYTDAYKYMHTGTQTNTRLPMRTYADALSHSAREFCSGRLTNLSLSNRSFHFPMSLWLVCFTIHPSISIISRCVSVHGCLLLFICVCLCVCMHTYRSKVSAKARLSPERGCFYFLGGASGLRSQLPEPFFSRSAVHLLFTHSSLVRKLLESLILHQNIDQMFSVLLRSTQTCPRQCAHPVFFRNPY